MDTTKALLVITRATRAERQDEAILEATAMAVEQAIEVGAEMSIPTEDSFFLLTKVTDIGNRVLKYRTSPDYEPLWLKKKEGYYILFYPYTTTDITPYDFSYEVEIYPELETEAEPVIETRNNITKRTLRAWTADGSTDTEYETHAEVLSAINGLNPSDGYAYLYDAVNLKGTKIHICRPPLYKQIGEEDNPFIVPELNKPNSIGRNDNDRY